MSKLRYQIHTKYGALLMHRSNDLDDLIARATQLAAIFGDTYQIKDMGRVVWNSEEGLL